MSVPDALALACIAAAVTVIVCIFYLRPDFRRAFIDHWRPDAIAKRLDKFNRDLDEWAKRGRR